MKKKRKLYCLTTVLLIFASWPILKVKAQNLEDSTGNITIVKAPSLKKEQTPVLYIGEIKGRSYVKISLRPSRPDDKLKEPTTPNTSQYYGSCYEAASNKVYELTASYYEETGKWEIKGYNIRRQYVCLFSGKEDSDGNIAGFWRNKHSTFSFYLFLKDKKE